MAEIELVRTANGSFEARNGRGAAVSLGNPDSGHFTPVELLLAAIAGCSALDVEVATLRRAEPDGFRVSASAEKVVTEEGNKLANIVVEFQVSFPDGTAGDQARAVLPRAARQSHDRYCTVSRTIEGGVPVVMRLREA
jgi:uncharacterized OsmC-like protein